MLEVAETVAPQQQAGGLTKPLAQTGVGWLLQAVEVVEQTVEGGVAQLLSKTHSPLVDIVQVGLAVSTKLLAQEGRATPPQVIEPAELVCKRHGGTGDITPGAGVEGGAGASGVGHFTFHLQPPLAATQGATLAEDVGIQLRTAVPQVAVPAIWLTTTEQESDCGAGAGGPLDTVPPDCGAGAGGPLLLATD